MHRRPAASAVVLLALAGCAGVPPAQAPPDDTGPISAQERQRQLEENLGATPLPVLLPDFTACGTAPADPARTHLRPHDMTAADAAVDPDRYGPVDGTLRVEDAGDLVLVDGVIDAGNGYEVGYGVLGDPHVQVADATVTAPVSVAVLDTVASGRRVAAVEVKVGASAPVTWEESPDMLVLTDGGDGGFLAPQGLPTGVEVDGWGYVDAFHPDEDADVVCVQRRSSPDGPVDGVLFSTGWGDGAYPVLLGRAADGAVVSVLCWTDVVPWSTTGLPGTPPPEWGDPAGDVAT